ncbi:hypothetical protein LJ753_11085 [Arthrobacter sp. zg-Y20]|uniref:hypothetical protein n=1 Tax=unclassified Arthrobacter TaxID=235627 RepID=UPI001D13D1FD|nr:MULTISPECIES: hypothetical protein [unclassified Arthrobacter]MCC3276413.1 hypothetical protein [Arthrobacter sp. zg-Y20]MDK1316572.1 hypothetical protein [Arthrobacter sp. zg.Y20]MDK1328723.1 hypothetical protein [Arthrobacter sp. zg-Y1143]WIB06612.1 hypothetical protein QNO06_02385 [Arthrobacter sp. zg-Y20]
MADVELNGSEPSAQVQEDLNSLLGTALGVTQEQLEAQGAFLPAALVVQNDGELRMIAVSPEESDEDLDADAMIDDLYTVLTEQKGENRAVAVFSDIHLPEENTDAIHVVTEHSEGVCISAIQTYSNDGDEWTFNEPTWESGDRIVWAPEA